MIRAALASFVFLLLPTLARAEDKPVITADLNTGITMIGPNEKHLTGGFTLRGAADYAIPIGERAQIGLGVNGSVHGMGGQDGSMGFFVGPLLRLIAQPIPDHSAWNVALSVGFDVGRFAQCTRWEHPICPHFYGFNPALRPTVFYRSESGLTFGGYGSARFISSPIAFVVAAEAGMSIGLTFTRL